MTKRVIVVHLANRLAHTIAAETILLEAYP